MKYRTTGKEIKARFSNIFTVGYCDLPNLLELARLEAEAYNAGVYGWNYDLYTTHNAKGVYTAIVTGYRPFNAKRIDTELLRACEQYAKELLHTVGYSETTSDFAYDLLKGLLV